MEEEIFTPSEAVIYLRDKRGLIFTVDGLRNRRRNKQAFAHRVLTSTTLWTKAELDAIVPSRKTKTVVSLKKSENDGGDASVMMLRKHELAAKGAAA
jgi:hypothetical protein